jgi:ribosomal protein S8
MKTIIKKIVAIFTLVLALSLGAMPASALENDVNRVYTEEGYLNEFEYMQELATNTDSILSERGYNLREIAEIRNYEDIFCEHINELNKLDDRTLESIGYSEIQINGIRNFSGTKDEMTLLSATMSLSATTVSFVYDGNYSRGRIAYTWSWSGAPACLLADMIAVSWNVWAVESQVSYVNYYHINTGVALATLSATYTQDGNGTSGAAHKFSMRYGDYYYARSGSGNFDVRSDVHAKKDFYYYIWATTSRTETITLLTY